MTGPAAVIVCVECGGAAHLIQALDPDNPLEPGDIAVYRCAECQERWDIVVTDDDVRDD